MPGAQDSKVSIIIPTYNRASILPRAIDSCLKQTYANIEIIIINDSSTDNTEAVASAYCARDSRIKYFKNPVNLGLSGALNAGIDKASGEYIAFLDDDGEYLPERIRVRLAMAKYLSPEPELIYGNVWNETIGKETVYPKARKDKFITINDVLRGEYFFTGQMTWLVKRGLLLKYRFDRKMVVFQDVDLLLRIIAGGERVFYFDRPLGIHHNAPGISSINPKSVEGRQVFIEKHILVLKKYPLYLSRLYYCMAKDYRTIGLAPKSRKLLFKAFLTYPFKAGYLFKALRQPSRITRLNGSYTKAV